MTFTFKNFAKIVLISTIYLSTVTFYSVTKKRWVGKESDGWFPTMTKRLFFGLILAVLVWLFSQYWPATLNYRNFRSQKSTIKSDQFHSPSESQSETKTIAITSLNKADEKDTCEITNTSMSAEDEDSYKKLKKQKDRLQLQHAIASAENNLIQLQNTLLIKEIGNLETVKDLNNFKEKYQHMLINLPHGYTPSCRIKGKDSISAINRAVSDTCKKQIAELACRSVDSSDGIGNLYPTHLPNLCLTARSQNNDLAGQHLGR